jgi:soluble lytic murein transglycosylase-like protein
LVALCLCAEALVAIAAVPVPAPRAPIEAEPSLGKHALPRSRWLVRVDGWTLGLDDVAKRSLSGWLPPAAGYEGVAYESDAPAPFPFHDLIVSAAAAEGLDWRLVAALIAEESGFNPTSESPAGAYGLMQVRPIAAREVREPEFRNPPDNIRTGVRYLKRLMELFSVPDPHQQLGLVLAAYNMGPAHLTDAQALAARYGLAPQRWYDSVELVLPLLEQPAIYTTIENGYAQGRQTVRYVRRVLARYERLRQGHHHLARGASTRNG